MISKLTIDNYALIDKSAIDFKNGFTVITGETGAGKSIMLDALSLLMGARADSKVISNKDRKTVIEAVFSNPNKELADILEGNGIEWDDKELIIRRELTVNGRSRSFVNDTPVNLSILSKISSLLLDIHSQHTNFLLNTPQEQLALIDAFGETEKVLSDYKTIFRNYVSLRGKIKKIKDEILKGKENKEFLMFRLEQLDKIKPKHGELAELEQEAEILGDADRIKAELSEATFLLANSSNSSLKSLQNAISILGKIEIGPDSEEIIERLDSLKIELKDISDTLQFRADNISSDPDRLEKIQNRINLLYEAIKRFKLKDEEELIKLYQQLKEELRAINGDNSDISSFESKLRELAVLLKEKANQLSALRTKAAEKFSKTIVDRIKNLGLPNLKFSVDIMEGKMTIDGKDQITFLCSFNKNHEMQPISEIASGGEISRVMLGIKSLISQKMNLPTIIFDEIDTGVSGEIAHKMGRMMKEMSDTLQIIAVTHLPQVAVNGDYHLKVYKIDEQNRTISLIKELDETGRIYEVAGMLSGNTINEAALENAKVLLNKI